MPNQIILKFYTTTALSDKKKIVQEIINKTNKPRIKSYIKQIPTLSDRKRFIDLLTDIKGQAHYVNKFSILRQLSKVTKDIKKHSIKVYRRIITKNRHGKKFEDIVLEKLAPLIRNNEEAVIDLVIKKLIKLPEKSPIKEAYGSFLINLNEVLKIGQAINNEGVNKESIERVLFKNKATLRNPEMSSLIIKVLALNPLFNPFKEIIDAVLSAIAKDEDRKYLEDKLSQEKKVYFDELGKIEDINKFMDKAEEALSPDEEYLDEITRLFQLLVYKPLIYSYKLLKFTINREALRKWAEDVPVSFRLSKDIRKAFYTIKEEMERKFTSIKAPQNFDELLSLVYNHKISFTDKYKLLAKEVKNNQFSELVIECMKKIKDVQYKVEYSFVHSLLSLLKKTFSFDEIKLLINKKRTKTEETIQNYKKTFKTFIQKLIVQLAEDEQNKFEGLVKNIEEEIRIDENTLLAACSQKGEEKNLKLIIRVANFLTEYYIHKDLLNLLNQFDHFYYSLMISSGIFLKNRISFFTKEDIYSFIYNNRGNLKIILDELTKYLTQGEYEARLRIRILNSLGVQSPNQILKKGSFNLIATKYGTEYKFRVTELGGKQILIHKENNLKTFMDFLNILKNEGIQKYIQADNNQLKVIFHSLYISNIRELLDYISLRMSLFTQTNPFVEMTKLDLKEAYKEGWESDSYIDEIVKKAEGEKDTVLLILTHLKNEKENSKFKTMLPRIIGEIKYYQGLVRRIDTNLSFIRGIKKILYSESIEKSMEDKPADEQLKILKSELDRIKDNDDRLGTVSCFFITSNLSSIINKSKDILLEGNIDDYKILLSFMDLVNSKNDDYLKLKIIESFSEYLRLYHSGFFIKLNYLLNIYKKKIASWLNTRQNKILELWDNLDQISDREKKISYLEKYLEDHNNKSISSFVNHIKDGFVNWNLKTLFINNKNLPICDQYDIFYRFKTYLEEASLPQVEVEDLKNMGLELEVRKSILTSPGECIFKYTDFEMLMKKPYYDVNLIKQVQNNIDASFIKIVLKRLKRLFLSKGILEDKITQYINTHFNIKDNPKKNIQIDTLEGALDYFGLVSTPGDRMIINEIIDLLKVNQVNIALSVLKSKVVVECAKEREVGRLSRLLNTLKGNDIVKQTPEMKKAVFYQLSLMKRFIINKAKSCAGPVVGAEEIEDDGRSYTVDENINIDVDIDNSNKSKQKILSYLPQIGL